MINFEFDGETLAEKGYLMVSGGSEDETIPVSEMTYNTIKASLSDVHHKVSHNYENNYSRTFAIIKSPCEDNDSLDMTEDEISEMTRWLVRKQYKDFRYIDDEGNPLPTWYLVQNTVSKMEYGDAVIGLQVTVNSNAPYGFSDRHIIAWSTTVDPEVLHKTIVTDSDEEGYIYPDIVIEMREAGDLVFNNRREMRQTRINNVKSGEIIAIRGADVLRIESDDATHDLTTDFNYVFPRLCSTYEDQSNLLATNLQCDVRLMYRDIRKVGL